MSMRRTLTCFVSLLAIACGSAVPAPVGAPLTITQLKFAVIDSESGKEAISGIAQRLGSEHASLDWKMDASHTRDLQHADHDVAYRRQPQ